MWISTPNIDILRRSAGDAEVRRLVSAADIVVADGAPVVWAAKLGGRPLPERVAGSALLWSMSAAAARSGRGIYLLGGEPGVAESGCTGWPPSHDGCFGATSSTTRHTHCGCWPARH